VWTRSILPKFKGNAAPLSWLWTTKHVPLSCESLQPSLRLYNEYPSIANPTYDMERPLSPASARPPTTSSFPVPLPTAGSTRAPSVISSRMTDIASEDGDEFRSERAANGPRPTTATSNDPNRPGSATSSQTRPSARASQSRRGGMGSPTTMGSWRTVGAFGGPGGSITNSSRPPSSTSRASRTHVPSLAAHSFFRPMSSQRLQAQRGVRQPRGRPTSSVDGYSDAGTETHRHSVVSDATVQHGGYTHYGIDNPPPSRGTEFTEQEEQGAYDTSPTENAGSERPLHNSASYPRPAHLNLDKPDNGSPKSWRGSFHRTETQGHERLSSSNNSPTFAKRPPSAPPKAGINYQYFSGNTSFCWGGRLQNTRDRPVNVASAIIVILPAILFLVYS